MADIRKRGHETPTVEDEKKARAFNENESALMAELERKARALRLSETDSKITVVPHQQPGFRRLEVEERDRFESFEEFEESSDVEMEVEAVFGVLNGADPDPDLDKFVMAQSIENIREALKLVFKELNEVLLESIDELVEEAIGLDIDVSWDAFDDLRSREFHEMNEGEFLSGLQKIEMPEAVQLVRGGRCEVAWVKDTRERLVDYVEEAKAIHEVNGTHELRFEFSPRESDIELLEDQERDRVWAERSGVLINAQMEDDVESPTKRQKSPWHKDTTQSAGPSTGVENVEDWPVQD